MGEVWEGGGRIRETERKGKRAEGEERVEKGEGELDLDICPPS